MFKTLIALGLAGLLSFVSAQQTISGQYDCMPAGDYTLCQNLWGECKCLSRGLENKHLLRYAAAVAGVGGQNSTLLAINGNAVSWQTNWTWANAPNNVKSCKSQTCVIVKRFTNNLHRR